MNRWDFEKLLSAETKQNIGEKFKEKFIKDMEEEENRTMSDEEISIDINTTFDNSIWELLKYLMDDKELKP